jgi:glycosyltransferase involved in cell wall biosynthesis
MGPVKVCLLIESLAANAGNELLLTRLANALDPSVIEAHVCCLASGPMPRLNPSLRTAVFPFNSPLSANGLRQILRFRRYLKTNDILAVHAFENKTAFFSVLASLGYRGRAVITSRLNCGYWYTRKLIWVFRLLNLFSSHIFANSAAGKNVTVAVENVSPDKITVFYPGVDLSRFSPRSGNPAAAAGLGIPPEMHVVGIVANFRPVKNLALFLRAASIVAAAVPGSAFLLVGQGALKTELQQLAVELGIADRVFFSEPGVPVWDYLARMSVGCLSSKSEGLPNAILEYMAVGLPVVSTDVGGVSELVRAGVNGYLTREHSPRAFAEPIVRLLRDPELRAAMGGRGLERAQREFDGAAAARRLEQFYLDAVADVQGRGTTTRP